MRDHKQVPHKNQAISRRGDAPELLGGKVCARIWGRKMRMRFTHGAPGPSGISVTACQPCKPA